jgi:hypothetical protein
VVMSSWILFVGAAAATLALVWYLYRNWEPPGRGRWLLAGLRWGALLMLILLLINPPVPLPGAARGLARERVLLDGSLSMLLPEHAGDGQTRWQRGVALARELAGTREVLVFGGATPRLIHPDSLAAMSPSSAESRLLPALQAASEAGTRRVVVITDGGGDRSAVSRAGVVRGSADGRIVRAAEPSARRTGGPRMGRNR